jgi:uncharacterized membrane protein
MPERVRSYNTLLVGGMFLWLFSIVFRPFPTELLSTAKHGSDAARHAIYLSTLVVAAIAVLVMEVAIVRSPDLQAPEHRGSATLGPAITLVVLTAAALVVGILVPAIGLWALALLVLSRPIDRLLERRAG